MFRAMLAVCALSSAARADTAYVIHPTEGVFASEFTRQPDACGQATRAELDRLFSAQAVLTVTADSLQLTTRDNRDGEAEEAHLGVDASGTWFFGTKRLRATLYAWKRDQNAKVLNVEIQRTIAGKPCRELWSGIVRPSITRDMLRE